MLSKIVRKIYGSYIPILNIQGTINNVMAQKIQHRLASLSIANSQALAVSVNTAGGLPVQSLIIANKLRMFAKKHHLKLFTFGGEIVASGGYLILAQGDEVYCDVSSAIGSIGISIPKYDLTGGLEYLTLEHKRLRSHDNIFGQKIGPFHNLTQSETQMVKQVCQSMHGKLIQQVKQLRGNKLKKDDKIFDGSLFTGQQAKQMGLVDGVGSMVEILEKKYPRCRLGMKKQKSILNAFLKTY